jgi:phosphoserine phosphatase
LHTWQAFREGAAHRRDAADAWLERLTGVPQALVRDVVESVPEGHMSPAAKAFACALLECNAKLLGVR